MPNNATYSHEIYRLTVYIRRVLTLLCWLCQQLQQLTTHIVHWLDEERERRNQDESYMKIVDLDDVVMDDVDMTDDTGDDDMDDIDMTDYMDDDDTDDVDSD